MVDTHAWIWMVSQPERLSKAAGDAIEAADRVGVSAISSWEIATKVRRGRLVLDRPLHVWRRQALAADRVEELPVTGPVAVRAGELPDEVPGDPADRVIAATALDHGASLVTKDRRLRQTSSAVDLRWIW